MNNYWKITYYKTPSGKFPVKEFIDNLEASLRFFYVGKEFLILHGFTKKKQKIPLKEIKTALSRLKNYQTRS